MSTFIVYQSVSTFIVYQSVSTFIVYMQKRIRTLAPFKFLTANAFLCLCIMYWFISYLNAMTLYRKRIRRSVFGGRIETPGTCAFNIHSLSLSLQVAVSLDLVFNLN